MRIDTPNSRVITAICLLLTLAVAACAGRPEGVLTPVAAGSVPAQASTVTMLVATSRKPSGNPATLFSGERSPVAVADRHGNLDPAPNRVAGTVDWPKSLPADPRKDFAVIRAQNLTSVDEGRGWLNRNDHDGHVLVFIHGFNNRYEDSVFRLRADRPRFRAPM